MPHCVTRGGDAAGDIRRVLGFVLTDTYLHVPDFSECQRKASVERWQDGDSDGEGEKREIEEKKEKKRGR